MKCIIFDLHLLQFCIIFTCPLVYYALQYTPVWCIKGLLCFVELKENIGSLYFICPTHICVHMYVSFLKKFNWMCELSLLCMFLQIQSPLILF